MQDLRQRVDNKLNKQFGDIVSSLAEWEQEHQPFDRTTRLPLFQFTTIEPGNSGALVPFSNSLADVPEKTLHLSDYALGQMLTRVIYPRHLYNRLPAKLNLLNINWLTQNGAYDKDTLFRMQDGDQVRAILSNRYEPFDHVELFQMLEPYCQDGIIRWNHKDDMTLHVSISWPSTQEEIRKGDIVEQGIHISNSEVGARSVTVSGYVYRLICSNGAIGGGGGDSFRFRHTGDSSRIRDAVESAIQSTKLEATKITAMFKRAIEQKIDDPFNRIEQLAKENNLTQDQFKKSLDAFMMEPEDNAFGVSQAFSAAAHQFTGEASYDLQRVSVTALQPGS